MTKDYNLARNIFHEIWSEKIKLNWSGNTSMINSSSMFRELFYPAMEKYFKSKTCETCKHLNNENNYCPIIDQFNEVEFGCINHCL